MPISIDEIKVPLYIDDEEIKFFGINFNDGDPIGSIQFELISEVTNRWRWNFKWVKSYHEGPDIQGFLYEGTPTRVVAKSFALSIIKDKEKNDAKTSATNTSQ